MMDFTKDNEFLKPATDVFSNRLKDALIAYAKLFNTLDSTEFETMLAGNFTYESQAVLSKLTGKEEFVQYIRLKLQAIKEAKSSVYAELAQLEAYGQRDCVLLAQDSKDNLVATAFIVISQDKVERLDVCTVPDPKTAIRTGIYPK